MTVIDPEMLRTIVTAESLPSAEAEAGAVEELTFRSGNKYVGTLANGTTMDGSGAFEWAATGVSYKGDWAGNDATGAGAYSWPDGCSYEGQLVAGVRHGVGTFKGPGGFPCYEGDWKDGRRHGVGKLVYAAGGDVYEGQWVDDMREGQGTLTHANGNVYTGEWSLDAKNGQGTFEWFDRREQYVGGWKDGKPHGQGEHVWLRVQVESSPFQLRERYVGEFVAGERDGHGTFHYASGARYVGAWSANQKHGDGLFSFEDGSVYQGPFEYDRMTSGSMRASNELFTYIDLADLVPMEQVDMATAAVKNVLTRYNTDVKQVYRYYAALGCASADAFVLDLSQFRSFAVDTGLVSRDVPLATLGDLVMRASVDPSPTGVLPSPYVLATTVSGEMSGVPLDMRPQLETAAKFERRGVHEPTRKLLLREFAQGLIEIAHLRLGLYGAVSPPEHPIHPLAQSLLDMLKLKVLSSTPTSAEEGAAAAAAEVSATARTRLQLVYGHYAAAEPPPRCKKPTSELTLTVRAYVRVLSEAGLLPPSYSAYKLLDCTLPSYYLKPKPSPPATDEEAATAPAVAPLSEEALEAAEVEVAAEGDEAGAAPAAEEPTAAVAAAAEAEAEAEVEDFEDLEELLDLTLIYSEFEACILTFARLSQAVGGAPWAVKPPPPPAAEEAAADEEAAPEEAAAEEEAPVEEAAPVEEVAAPEPLAPEAVLEEQMLPAMGAFLLSRLGSMASDAA